MIEQIAIAGYRSIYSIILKLGRLNVVTGPNGSGKSNVYRALRLLASGAQGTLGKTLAAEGGMASVLWAGTKLRNEPVSLRLGFRAEPFSYALDLGYPQPSDYVDRGEPRGTQFGLDPVVKRECIWRGNSMQPGTLCADRRTELFRCRDAQGRWREVNVPLAPQASMLAEYSDPFEGPEVIILREIMRSWRFYDTFRTDPDAPARRVSVATRTPVMSDDGSDMAAALQTIRENGDQEALDAVIDDAFPGSQLAIYQSEAGLHMSLLQPGMSRTLTAAELSDGTLRFLLLAAALLTPRPPKLLVINEPETSLHPDLIPALTRLVARAAEASQVIVVTHNAGLVEKLEKEPDCVPIRLQKPDGQTEIENGSLLDQRGWKWPTR